jgi:hypothetical protein
LIYEPRDDVAPEISVDTDAVHENDRRTDPPLAVLDGARRHLRHTTLSKLSADGHRPSMRYNVLSLPLPVTTPTSPNG